MPAPQSFLHLAFRTLALAVCCVAAGSFAAESGGTITGNVSNAATGNLLEGASITVPALGLATLADRDRKSVV